MEDKYNSIRNLVRGLDIIARDMNTISPIPMYLPLIGVLFTLVWLVSSIIGDLTSQYYTTALQLVGLIGFIGVFTSSMMVVYKLCQHVEYSAYYFSHLSDILENLGLVEISSIADKLSLLGKPRIEYMLVGLVAGLFGLLLQSEMIIRYSGFIAFLAVLAYYYHYSLKCFNDHMNIEDEIITSKIKELLGIEKNTSPIRPRLDPGLLPVFVALTGSAAAIYLAYIVNDVLDTHLADHRSLHRSIKTSIARKLEEEKQGSQIA